MGKTRDFFKKIGDSKGAFHVMINRIKDKNGKDLTEAEARRSSDLTHPNGEFQRIARRDKKAFLSEQCKEIEENNSMGKLEISTRKLEIPREYLI